MGRNPSAVSGLTVATAATGPTGATVQHQATHFDGAQIPGRSFDESDLSDSSFSSS